MSGLFGILDTANKGIQVSQLGLRVTGHNISNADNPNYSRQRLELGTELPQLTSAGALGRGPRAVGVERVTEPFVEGEILRQAGASGAASTQADALGVLEEILNEQDGPGIIDALGTFYDSFSDLATATNPGAPTEREALVSSAQLLVDTFANADRQMRQLLDSTNDGILVAVDEVNQTAERIAELNDLIVKSETIASANDLRDERDALNRRLASLIDVDSFEQSDGALNVMVRGGLPIVDGVRANQLQTSIDPANPFGANNVRIEYTAGNVSFDITSDIGGGEIGGLLRARDTIIPGAIRSLDTIAYNLSTSVNTIHATGQGLNAAVGDFFVTLPQVEDAARDLQIEAAILADSDSIAAGTTGLPGDNSVATQLADLRSGASAIFLPGDPPGPATGPNRSVIEYAVSVAADIGQQARTLETSSQQQIRVLEDLQNRRDSIVGVSVDEEVTQLVRLQASFQANARVIGVVQDLLDEIFAVI